MFRACVIAIAFVALSAGAQTVAYWRFEDLNAKPGDLVRKVPDLSGNGNDLASFSEDTAPKYSVEVASATVPQTGETNRLSFDNSNVPGRRLPTRDLFIAHQGDGFDLVRDQLNSWTIELSVKFKPIDNWNTRWQAMIAREGYNIPNRDALHEDQSPCLTLKKRGDNNRLSIEAYDSTNKQAVIQSIDEVQVDVWYHLAVVSDGKSLAFYLKKQGDDAYTKQGEVPFTGSLANQGLVWAVGRGAHGGGPADQCYGLMDEVRISAAALTPERFLMSASDHPIVIAPAKIASDPKARVPELAKFPPAPADLIHPHDPTTIFDGKWYHVFSTEGGLHHWRSKDLLAWEELPRVFEKTPEWGTREIAPHPGLWAPDVLFFNGRFNLYYSLSTFGGQKSAICLLTNKMLNPDEAGFKWEDQGPVVRSFPGDSFNTIDPTIFFDADQKPWLAWGSYWRGIYLAPVDVATGKVLVSKDQYHHLAERKGNTAIEAPHVFYRNGWYYLICSYDACCRGASSTYKLMVGRSKQATGPYLDRDNQPMLQGNASLLIRGYEFYRGPGHSSVVPKEGELILTHHYYDARANGMPTLAARPLYFDDQGWPLVGEPIDTLIKDAASPDFNETWTTYEDYGRPEQLQFTKDGRVTGRLGEGTWKIEQNRLVIEWPARGRDQQRMIDLCFLAKDLRSFVGRRSDGTIVSAIRQN